MAMPASPSSTKSGASPIAAWGLVLEPEGGKKNEKLWNWYLSQGFKECRALSNTESMYAPLSAFLPELQV
jgi:hypothetical protein